MTYTHLNTALVVLGIAAASLLSTAAPDDIRVDQATADTVAERGAEHAQLLADVKFEEVRHAVR